MRFRKGLVVAQVSLSLLLLVGAGLFIRSLGNLRDLGPGFPTGNLVSFNLDTSTIGYSTENAKALYQRLVEEVSSVPGVRSTGLAGKRILEGDEWDNWVTVEGHHLKANEIPDAYMNSISPGYLATLGVPILAGRDLTARDTATMLHELPDRRVAAVVLVNEKFAKTYFGSAGEALGRHVGFGIDPNTKTDMEIVGVFKDIKYTNIRDDIRAQMCVPYMTEQHVGGMTVYVRTTLATEQFFAAVRAKVRALDPNLPVYGMTTLDEQVSNSLLVERLIASLSTVFGFLATLLAVIGLYGVMAYTVTRRTREIGIRMALGAFQKHVIWMVMREVLALVAVGIAVGLGATFALTRLVQSQLYGITPSDPATLGLATLTLTAVACAAGYIPALRASRVDAMEALRQFRVLPGDIDLLSIGTTEEPFHLSRGRGLTSGMIQWARGILPLFMQAQTDAAMKQAALLLDRVPLRVSPVVAPKRFSIDDTRRIQELCALGVAEARINESAVRERFLSQRAPRFLPALISA